MERHIAAEWSATLECPAPDIDTNFFDLGGTSLLMAELQNRLERRLGLRIPMLTLLEYPAVRLLAAHLTSAGAPAINRPAGRRPASPDASRRIAVRAQLRSEDLW
jgi:acyl carrier protein